MNESIKLRFRAEITAGHRSDIGLDDIMLHITKPVCTSYSVFGD